MEEKKKWRKRKKNKIKLQRISKIKKKKGRGTGCRETKIKIYRRLRATAATRSSEICQGTKRRESEEAFRPHEAKRIEAAKAKEI